MGRAKVVRVQCLTVDESGNRCSRLAVTCGLCAACYATFRYLEKRKRVDRAKCEAEGKILPRKGTRGVVSFFLGNQNKSVVNAGSGVEPAEAKVGPSDGQNGNGV